MLIGERLTVGGGWNSLAAFIGGMLVVTFGILLSARRYSAARAADEDESAVADTIASAIATLSALLLAFVVVVVWEKYNAIRDTVANETGAIHNLMRETQRLPEPRRSQILGLLQSYTEQVRDNDWPILASTGKKPIDQVPLADATLDRLWRAVIVTDEPQDHTLNDAIVAELKELNVNRTHRFALARDGVTGPLWLLLILSSVATVALTIFRYRQLSRKHMPIFLFYAAFLGAMLWLVADSDDPFGGTQRIRADPFEYATRMIQAQRKPK
ncbi:MULTISPECIES: hypothetical protein [unclassified Caballeronia]|uniref:bestrophin-like domain n=1 Tax=unclassified Caballeronia TaxID=2646786 RepID=UPI00285AF76C|nr:MULTISPECIES: hypothetical protein [unclassified Caballeronia]MDR5771232.1 DUF4239 domain-containing protein [Caballeronia sp. LZ002]MDR5800538.1 DUF4239 domain-containing protein [Caballeronia sp. LZ001]MDR5846668.1 DUF4239 domain-containing protein [Caballeronia sp. LZ003]